MEPKVPVYLLVGGCFGLLKLLATVWRNVQARRYEDAEVFYDSNDSDSAFASRTFKTMEAFLTLFLVGWLILGTYWVYQVYPPHYKQLLHEPSNWCERTVYLFALYQMIGSYSFIALLLFLATCFAGYYKCLDCFNRISSDA